MVRRTGLTWMISVLVHVGLVTVITLVAVANMRHQREEDDKKRDEAMREPINIELPLASDGTVLSQEMIDRVGVQPIVTGGATVERLDTNRAGHGGDATSQPATHLSDRDENLHLTPDSVSHLDRDQMQRIRSNVMRASWEDRRMTTHPMELTFISNGEGDLLQRHTLAKTNPSRGAARSADPAAHAGGALGGERPFAGDDRTARHDLGADREGALDSSAGLGLHDGRAGEDHRASADSARARPDVSPGAVAVAATFIDRPRDNVDSPQDVAAALRSIVHGSYAGGALGDGRGGSGGGGASGADGTSGEGSHPQPLGVSDGEIYDLETSDPRLLPYFRRLKAKIDPLWQNAFPRSAIIDLKQGTVILEITVSKDGSAKVAWPPLRPSGIDEFDRNCADAVRRAMPFEAIPAVLGVTTLHIRAPFVANNFVVK